MLLDRHQFLFLTGKGGVGKTTTALALGRYFARLGRRVVVASSSGNRQLLSLARVSDAPEPVEASPGLFVCAIDPEEAMRQYVEHQLKSTILTQVLFQKSVAKGFLDGIPGLRQWALLGKAWALSEPNAPGPKIPGAPFDLVIFDAPSTGDSTELLKLPRLIKDLVPLGPLSRDASRCQALFEDSKRFAILVVTIAEDLPITEALELLASLRKDIRIPAHAVVLNRVIPRFFPETLRSQLSHIELTNASDLAREVVLTAKKRAAVESAEEEAARRLSAEHLPLLRVPELSPGPTSLAELDTLCRGELFREGARRE